MRQRENPSARRSAVGQARRTILVYCGALRTEPAYLDGLKRRFRTSALTVKIRMDGIAPGDLVRKAAGYRDRRPGAYDEVWCVVDVDQFDIDTAVTLAAHKRVNLAVSNPCFELWLLLQHTDCRVACAGAGDVLRRLRRHVPHYDKARLDLADFAAGISDAIKRARHLEPTGQEHRRNPSTSVWRLVEQILGGR